MPCFNMAVCCWSLQNLSATFHNVGGNIGGLLTAVFPDPRITGPFTYVLLKYSTTSAEDAGAAECITANCSLVLYVGKNASAISILTRMANCSSSRYVIL